MRVSFTPELYHTCPLLWLVGLASSNFPQALALLSLWKWKVENWSQRIHSFNTSRKAKKIKKSHCTKCKGIRLLKLPATSSGSLTPHCSMTKSLDLLNAQAEIPCTGSSKQRGERYFSYIQVLARTPTMLAFTSHVILPQFWLAVCSPCSCH